MYLSNTISDGRWMNAELFVEFLRHIKNYRNCTKDDQILYVANHTIYFRENGCKCENNIFDIPGLARKAFSKLSRKAFSKSAKFIAIAYCFPI